MQCRQVELIDCPERLTPPVDCVILATKSTELQTVAAAMLPFMGKDAFFITTQNGLVALRLAKDLDGNVVPGVVLWGATMPRPGIYEVTARGSFLLGEIGGGHTERVETARTLLSSVFPAVTVQNIEGALWAKLLITASLTSFGAITGLRFGPLVMRREARELFLEVGNEGLRVAGKCGIVLAPLGGILRVDLLMSERGMPLWSRHLLMGAMGFRHRRTESSMLDSLRRGRKTEIDDLNGAIVECGAEVGVPTPLNTRIVEVVRRIENGSLTPGPENLSLFR